MPEKSEQAQSSPLRSGISAYPLCGSDSGTAFTETRSKPASQVLPLTGRSLPATPRC
ncbi:MAG: hypothetical protein IJ207_06885 [Treponema sp.]|uniref:hypothetical protein n=1 Tax=Treponema sp. TaxID=166 RepID=UPI0025F86818|nr:hypothetical protein [Treponema sp.]MBQ9281909.1 hypothetical protein [Treponema sp.]